MRRMEGGLQPASWSEIYFSWEIISGITLTNSLAASQVSFVISGRKLAESPKLGLANK